MKELQEKAEGKVASKVPVYLTDDNFQATVEGNPLVLVDFFAEWCHPCHMVAPVIEALAADYNGKLLIGKLNIDENQKTAGQLQVMSIPTLVLFKGGKAVERIVGAVPRDYIEEKIKSHL
jgi:thioredoxin 1